MKNMNNFILNEYQKLFFTQQGTNNQEDLSGTSKNITQKEFLSNAALLKKSNEELRFCEDKSIDAKELI
jgi:hypothetical protein